MDKQKHIYTYKSRFVNWPPLVFRIEFQTTTRFKPTNARDITMHGISTDILPLGDIRTITSNNIGIAITGKT